MQLGALGEEWLAELPRLIADIERAWSISIVRSMLGGTAGYVALVRTGDKQDAVLKLAIPDEEFSKEVHTLARAEGRGYVNLLAYDITRYAMLQEALGPSIAELELAPEHALRLLTSTLKQAWQVPQQADLNVISSDEKAEGLFKIVDALSIKYPCPQSVITRALTYAQSRINAFDISRFVILHGDPHPANALKIPKPRTGAESGFVFVDPDGFIGDPAYDLGVVLRDWSSQLLAAKDPLNLAHTYCRLLASESGIDENAIWEWSFLERVSTGLYCASLGLDIAQQFLESAELLL